MTRDECLRALTALRRQQGTRCPKIRVDAGGTIYRGHLRRSGADPEFRASDPVGLVVIAAPEHGEAAIPIESIPSGGIEPDADRC